MEMSLPRTLYYFLVTVVTQLVLGVLALLILLPTGLLDRLPWSMIVFVLGYNVIVATLAAVMLTNRSIQNKPAMLKGDGLVLGHLVGLMLGGFIGLRYDGVIGTLIAACALYFILGWIGARISITVGSELDRRATPAYQTSAEKLVRAAADRRTPSLFIFSGVIPALFLIAAIFLKSYGFPVGQYPKVLPAARMLLIALSVLCILIPWLRRGRGAPAQSPLHSRASILAAVGTALSLAPAVYGFFLFVGFGMSIAELSVFALAASIASTTWGVRTTRS